MIAKRTVWTAVLFLAILTLVAQTTYADSRRSGRGRGGARHYAGGGRHAVPRHAVPARPYGHYGYPRYSRYYAYPWYPAYGYAPYYGYPGFGVGFGYSGFGFGFGFSFGHAYPYAYAPYGPYGYGPGVFVPIAGRPYGAVRIAIPERHASVSVDGYLVGSVDDFDGSLQHLNLERGPHKIQIAAPGFEPAEFEVNIRSGDTITYRTPLLPAR